MYYGNGDRHEGEYREGVQNGMGQYFFVDGDRFEGDFRDGKAHGFGRHYLSNGDWFEGQYQRGRRNGEGKYHFHDGQIYEGGYRDDKKHGTGKFFMSLSHWYEGEWKDGRRSGQGTLIETGGRRYDGEWRANHRNGVGKQIYSNGDCYDGEWKRDIRNGRGTFIFDGDRYAGHWQDGKIVGPVKVIASDGSVLIRNPEDQQMAHLLNRLASASLSDSHEQKNEQHEQKNSKDKNKTIDEVPDPDHLVMAVDVKSDQKYEKEKEETKKLLGNSHKNEIADSDTTSHNDTKEKHSSIEIEMDPPINGVHYSVSQSTTQNQFPSPFHPPSHSSPSPSNSNSSKTPPTAVKESFFSTFALS